MAGDSSWRAYLQQIINTSEKKQQFANQLNVETKTLERWMSGESKRPRPALIKQLISLLLPQEQETFITLLLADPDVAREDYGLLLQHPGSLANGLQEDIPGALYERVLEAVANVEETGKGERFTTIVDLVLYQLPSLLDPNRLGMSVFIVQCMPPARTKVQSLFVRSGRQSTDPLDLTSGRYYFLGRESLSGYCVSTCTRQVIDHSEQRPVHLQETFVYQASVAAVPIHRGATIAGCLLASSSQKQYFTVSRLDLLRKMANLVMLAFSDHEFYRQEDIALRLFPAIEEQTPYFKDFVPKALSEISQARLEGSNLHYQEAQQRLLRHIEQQFIEEGLRDGNP